jgi:hypothetical protein
MTDAAPMSEVRRLAVYREMNGSAKLTPRQRRRIDHKSNHADAPFGEKAE